MHDFVQVVRTGEYDVSGGCPEVILSLASVVPVVLLHNVPDVENVPGAEPGHRESLVQAEKHRTSHPENLKTSGSSIWHCAMWHADF